MSIGIIVSGVIIAILIVVPTVRAFRKPKKYPTIAAMNSPDYKRIILDSMFDDIDEDPGMIGDRAPYPHCDARVLHAPGECEYCDAYPDYQATRLVAMVNFTGHYDAGKSICPSERERPLETINRWPGNRAHKKG
jgi:hypothetical protein